MEWLGILLLYAISGYIKKRSKDAKNREIESDPEWDPPQEAPEKPQQPNLDRMLSDLFGQALKVEPEVLVEEEYVEEIVEPEPYRAPVHVEEHSSHVEEQTDKFEQNIHHSKLESRKELYSGKKGRKKNRLRSKLFDSKKSLEKAIILKEVLDKPLALR